MIQSRSGRPDGIDAAGRVGLSVVLPCYNEAANIPSVLRRLDDLCRQIELSCEAVVVDDGSADQTAAAAQEAAAQLALPVRIVRHNCNAGYGAALRSGVATARGRYIFLTDGDGQFDLAELPGAIRLLQSSDVVLGYRKRRRDRALRRLLGRCWTMLMNLCFHACVRDVDCAFKLVRAELLRQADLRCSGALVSTEIIVNLKASGVAIRQVPVRHLPRRWGRPTGGSAKVIAKAVAELVLNFLRLRRIRFSGGAERAKRAGPTVGTTL